MPQRRSATPQKWGHGRLARGPLNGASKSALVPSVDHPRASGRAARSPVDALEDSRLGCLGAWPSRLRWQGAARASRMNHGHQNRRDAHSPTPPGRPCSIFMASHRQSVLPQRFSCGVEGRQLDRCRTGPNETLHPRPRLARHQPSTQGQTPRPAAAVKRAGDINADGSPQAGNATGFMPPARLTAARSVHRATLTPSKHPQIQHRLCGRTKTRSSRDL